MPQLSTVILQQSTAFAENIDLLIPVVMELFISRFLSIVLKGWHNQNNST
jgi:hypothetical protein